MNLRLLAPLAALLLSGGLARAVSFVPATFQPQVDSMGFNWDMDQTGAIQSGTNCFSGVMNLDVNGSGFSSQQQATMTPDGSETFIQGTSSNVLITRRVKVDTKAAYVRYFDIITNNTGAAQNVRVSLRIQFNNQMQAAVMDSGGPLSNAFGPKDNGFLVMPQQGQSTPSALFLLAGRNGKIRPTVQNQQNYRFVVTYTLKMAPGEVVPLAYAVAQRTLPGIPDAKALAKLFASLSTSKLLSDVPAKERRALANFDSSSFSSGPSAPGFSSILERLGVERGPADVLAIGAETRLKGTASCTRLEVETPRGKIVVPFENVAALVGGKRETRVLLRDGQALSGKITAQGLKFSLATGTTINLNGATLDRLVLRALPSDVAAAGSWGFVETFSGDRYAVKADPALRLRATTAWGLREITLDELVGCGPTEDNPLGVRMLLKDGSYFLAFLDGDEIKFDTLLFGQQAFPTHEIRQVAVMQTKPVEEKEEAAPERAQVSVAGGQILAGQIDLSELHFLSPAGVIPVAANLIRTLRTASEEPPTTGSPVFTAAVWGGGSVTGTLREVVVPVRNAGSVFQVPVRDLVGAVVPSPAMPEGLRDKMAALLRDLGHADWEKREAASRELGELGGIARSALSETVKQTNDAEVRRRAQALLDTVDTQ